MISPSTYLSFKILTILFLDQSNYSMNRTAWNQGSRTTSQGAVPTPMVQSQQLYPSVNTVTVPQQPMAPPVLKQKSRSHAVRIINPNTMEEVDLNENNPENENSMNNVKNKVTIEVSITAFFWCKSYNIIFALLFV